MTANKLGAVLALAALGLSACDRGRMAANGAICASFKPPPANGQPVAPPLATDAAAVPVDECLRRWAYSLAASRDSADVVADAVIAACDGPMTRWAQGVLSGQPQGAPQGGPEGLSLSTGQPTNPLAEHSGFARGRATFYVVQARAGRCAPPPVQNGAPAGT